MQTKIVFFFLSLIGFAAYGQQRSLKDSSVTTTLVSVNYKANFTGGDMAQRWGFNNHLGLDVDYKFKSNLTLGIGGGFIFGNQLRDKTIFANLYNSYGTITSFAGEPSAILFLMRGATGHVNVGYVFNKLGNNPNSGLWVNFGLGYLMHKIRIESLVDDVPQLEGDYRMGYDKLTMGFSTKQFIGYLFQSDWRLLKFYAGFECVQGFTKNVRTYNFDTGGPETQQNFDLLYGIKLGWIWPIGQRTRSMYYSN